MADLLPCPFCGKSHGKITTAVQLLGEEYQDELNDSFFAVVCDASKPGGAGGCGAMGGFYSTEEDAIAVWNSRPDALCREAAEEIERLMAFVGLLENELSRWRSGTMPTEQAGEK